MAKFSGFDWTPSTASAYTFGPHRAIDFVEILREEASEAQARARETVLSSREAVRRAHATIQRFHDAKAERDRRKQDAAPDGP